MKPHEFFHRYANTPLPNRSVFLDMKNHESMTLNAVYLEVKRLTDKMRPDQIKLQHLLNDVEEFLPK